jgi:hypothetical protein
VYFQMSAPLGALGIDNLPPDTTVEFERTAALVDAGTPSVVVEGADPTGAAAAFRRAPFVDGVTRAGESEGRTVYRVQTAGDPPPLVAALGETDCTVLSADAADRLSLELRFPDRDSASRFYDSCDGSLDVDRSAPFGLAGQAERGVLTDLQAETLACAVAAGYFDVPRRTTLVELAQELGVSDTAVSQRLRRGVGNVLRTARHLPPEVRRAAANGTVAATRDP